MKKMILAPMLLGVSLLFIGCGEDSSSQGTQQDLLPEGCVNAGQQYYFADSHLYGNCGGPTGGQLNAFVLSFTQDDNCVITDDAGNKGLVEEHNVSITWRNNGTNFTVFFQQYGTDVSNATIRIKDGMCVLRSDLEGSIY